MFIRFVSMIKFLINVELDRRIELGLIGSVSNIEVTSTYSAWTTRMKKTTYIKSILQI